MRCTRATRTLATHPNCTFDLALKVSNCRKGVTSNAPNVLTTPNVIATLSANEDALHGQIWRDLLR